MKVREDGTINSEASPSHSVDVTNENGGSTHNVQVRIALHLMHAFYSS